MTGNLSTFNFQLSTFNIQLSTFSCWLLGGGLFLLGGAHLVDHAAFATEDGAGLYGEFVDEDVAMDTGGGVE